MDAHYIIKSFINGQFKQMIEQIDRKNVEMERLIDCARDAIGDAATFRMLKIYFNSKDL